jgi:hypothetical protein
MEPDQERLAGRRIRIYRVDGVITELVGDLMDLDLLSRALALATAIIDRIARLRLVASLVRCRRVRVYAV